MELRLCRKYILLAVFTLAMLTVLDSEIKFQAYVDRTRVGYMEDFRLTLEISGDSVDEVVQPKLDNITDFNIVSSSSSSSSSISIVNNRMERTTTRSFIYTLSPKSTGTFLIPPVSINLNRQTYTSDPISITVVEGTTQAPPQPSRSLDPRGQRQTEFDNIQDNLFIKTEINKKEFFRGEPIILSYVLYSRYDISNLSFSDVPNYEGFWKDDLYRARRISFQRKNHKGVVFNTMVLKTVSLIPAQTGNLSISGLATDVDVLVRARSFFDFDSSRRFSVRSEDLNLQIIPLPLTNRPDNFNGAVGNYDIEIDYHKSDFQTGDTFTLNVSLDGWGNFNHFSNPFIRQESFFRLLDPETNVQLSHKDSKLFGQMILKYPVILTEPGNFMFPAIQFSFFNPEHKSYYTIESDPFMIEVHEGEKFDLPGGFLQTSFRLSGQDINYIKTNPALVSYKPLSHSFIYWVFYFLIIATVPISYMYSKEKNRELGDKAYRRQKYANKIIKKYMNRAEKLAEKNDKAFYSTVYRGLSSFITDNLAIQRGSSTENIVEKLGSEGFEDKLVNKVKLLLDKCDRIRFMPGEQENFGIKEDLDVLRQIINSFSKQKNQAGNK